MIMLSKVVKYPGKYLCNIINSRQWKATYFMFMTSGITDIDLCMKNSKASILMF